MKSFIAVFAGSLAALTVCSCSMTSSLEEPVEAGALIASEKYLGTWSCDSSDSNFTLTVTPYEDSKTALQIQIIEKKSKQEKEFNEKWVPLWGGFFKTGDQLFLTVAVNIQPLFQDNRYNDAALWMISPRFYLLHVTENGKELELRFITFANKEGNEWKAIQPAIKLKQNIVLNSTSEIQELLRSKTYRLTDPVYVLKRK